MRIVRHLVLAIVVFASSNAIAQSTLCGSSGYPGFVTSDSAPGSLGFLNLLPENPDSAMPLTLEVGAASYVPRDVTSSVHGRTIDVTLHAGYNGIGVPPPIECLSTALGILAPGPYTINFQLVDLDFPGSPTVFTAQVVVGGGTRALAAPAASAGVLALLALLLGLVSVRWLRVGN